MNRPVLIFAVGISLFATLLCGLAPAYHAVRRDLQKSLAGTGVNVNAGFHHSRFRSGLVIGQVALSLLLLTCAGLIARSFFTLSHQDLGLLPENIFFADVHFPRGRYTKADEKRVFFDRLLPQLNSIPGVVSSTALFGLPLFFSPRGDVTIPGKPHTEKWMTNLEWCSEGYFETFGLHLLRGRLLSSADVFAARRVVVINEKLARKYFTGEDPIGRQIKFNVLDELPETPRDAYFEIVGVVSDARNFDYDGDKAILQPVEMAVPQGFVPYSISGFADRSIAMQTRVPPTSLVNSVRQILWSMDHDAVLVAPNVNAVTGFSLAAMIDGLAYRKPKFTAIAFGSCAGLGLALAIVGLFSVMTYVVSLKTHDIGIRLALGAPQSEILRMMLRQGLVLIGTGAGIGLFASAGITRFLSSQFHGISATDPLTFIVVVGAVMLAGLLACYMPSHRATRVDPMATLRNE